MLALASITIKQHDDNSLLFQSFALLSPIGEFRQTQSEKKEKKLYNLRYES